MQIPAKAFRAFDAAFIEGIAFDIPGWIYEESAERPSNVRALGEKQDESGAVVWGSLREDEAYWLKLMGAS